ncbi:MAG: HPP family protein [Patescibacteria group bacterium]
MQVKDIVRPAVIVNENDSFAQALAALMNHPTNTLLVTDDNGVLTGEVTVTDLLDAVVPDTLTGDQVMDHFTDDTAFIASIKVARDLPVADFMSYDYSALRLEDNLLAIVGTAIAHQRARIPVVDADNRPVGIISRQGLKQILSKFLTEAG